MRILMLTDFYPPIIGGLEQHVRTLSTELAARGHSVAVVTLWHPGLAEREVDQGVRVYRVRGSTQRLAGLFNDQGRRYAPPLPDPETTWAIRRIVRLEQPEIVHAHSWLVHSFLPLKSWSGARLVMSLHDYNLVCAKRTLVRGESPCSGPALAKCLGCAAAHYGPAKGVATVLANWVMGAAERSAVDLFLPVSNEVARASGLQRNREPFVVMPNFLPDEVAQPEDAEPYLAQLPKVPYLLFVGALGRHKGVEVLLRAYSGMREAPPLVLIGPQWLDTPAEFPPNVVVLKSWPNHAVRQAWRRSLVGIAPSLARETFGIAVLECMTAGRPVVASAIGALPDLVVDGQTGLLVPPGDPLALRRSLERLLVDSSLRERMGVAAKQRAANFRASAVVPRIERIYRELRGPGRERQAGERPSTELVELAR